MRWGRENLRHPAEWRCQNEIVAPYVEVVLHLVNAKCIPVLLYGLEACHLNKADIQSLGFCVYRLLMKLLCTNNLSIHCVSKKPDPYYVLK